MPGMDEYVLLLTENGAGGHVRDLAEGRNVAWKLTLHGWTIQCRRVSWSTGKNRCPVWHAAILEVHGFPKSEFIHAALAAVGRRHEVQYNLVSPDVTRSAAPVQSERHGV